MSKKCIRIYDRTGEVGGRKAQAGDIGGPRWNAQQIIDEQIQAIERNDRTIAKGWIVIVFQAMIVAAEAIVIYTLFNNV